MKYEELLQCHALPTPLIRTPPCTKFGARHAVSAGQPSVGPRSEPGFTDRPPVPCLSYQGTPQCTPQVTGLTREESAGGSRDRPCERAGRSMCLTLGPC